MQEGAGGVPSIELHVQTNIHLFVHVFPTFYPFPVSDIETFKLQLVEISNQVTHFCYLDSNNY